MSAKPVVNTRTEVYMTVDVRVKVGSWGPNCQLSQVYDQGAFEARNRVKNALAATHGVEVTGCSIAEVRTVTERT